MAKNFHMCMSVRGALLRSDKELIGVFRHDDGRNMTPREARLSLMDELAKGNEVIPLSKNCDNFDNKTGCRGHDHS